ncbi:MAG: efflux RND transporter periplasmic adaptor subunit [Chloroflexota bacterium]
MINKARNYGWVWGAFTLVALAGVLIFTFTQESEAQQVSETGETAVVFIGNLSESATASGSVEAQRSAQLQFGSGGDVAEVFVEVGDVVTAKEPLAQLETADLERAVADTEFNLLSQQANLAALQAPASVSDIAAAEAAVTNAEASLQALVDGPSEDEIAAKEATLRAAQADIAAASSRLSAAGGGSDDDIAAAQLQLEIARKAQVEAEEAHVQILVSERLSDERRAEIEPNYASAALQANADLATAQAALDEALNGNSNTVASNQASVAASVASRDIAEANLALLLEEASVAQIASAEASLVDAQSKLEAVLRGPTAEQVAIAEAQVAQAEVQLAQAQKNLAEATLVAPFAGMVTAVHVNVGEQAAGIAIEMVDVDTLEVVLAVDEVDVGQIDVGQTAVVTLETWPDDEIESTVTTIAPSANDNSGIVTFDVHLGLGTIEQTVLVGMTANADLITASGQGLLLVPNSAIIVDRQAGTYTVNLVGADGEGNPTTTSVEVTVGLSDSQYTEITSGLQVGDEVLLGVLTAPVDTGDDGPPRIRR